MEFSCGDSLGVHLVELHLLGLCQSHWLLRQVGVRGEAGWVPLGASPSLSLCASLVLVGSLVLWVAQLQVFLQQLMS